jgi:hypothetical protein
MGSITGSIQFLESFCEPLCNIRQKEGLQVASKNDQVKWSKPDRAGAHKKSMWILLSFRILGAIGAHQVVCCSTLQMLSCWHVNQWISMPMVLENDCLVVSNMLKAKEENRSILRPCWLERSKGSSMS